jgi:ATP-dependent DNA helicase RecG
MSMSKVRYIGDAESTTIEWKKSPAEIKEIVETVAAFSNTEGGKVFVGVSPEGRIAGLQIGKGTVESIANQIGQHTDPKVMPKITVKKIIIEVKESPDRLVLAFGRPHKRVGRSSPKMSKDEYERMILEKHKDNIHFDVMICRGATLKDIDPVRVQWFLDKAKEEKRLDVPENVTTREALEYLNVLSRGKPTNTGILLFGKEPQKFIVQSTIRAGRIKGTQGNDFLDMRVLEGTIMELRDAALRYIAEHTRKAVFFDANQRHDKWEYPFRALEEALNNALAHRDYRMTGDIQLAIYDDRIEIWNPGELSKEITLEQLKGKHRSLPRNPFLASRLYLIKYIERWGRGTNRIVEEMRTEKLSDPLFRNNSGGFEIVLNGPGKGFEKVIDDIKFHKLDLNARQKKALVFIQEQREMSRKQYVDLAAISVRQANRDLNDLVMKKVIVPFGSGRSLKYRLAE